MLTDVSERINAFPTQNTTFFRFNNPRRFATRAECMNAFPTKELCKHQFAVLVTKDKTWEPPSLGFERLRFNKNAKK